MQWASSMATNDNPADLRNSKVCGCTNRSGATYNSRNRPARISSATRRFSLGDWELLMHSAETPLVLRASTWSFIREISGETTTARPPRQIAGA